MKLGELIREQRLTAGHTLRALAALIDVHPSYLSRVERGLVPPSDALLYSVSDVLGLNIEEMFLRDGRVPPNWQPAISASPVAATRTLRESIASLPTPTPESTPNDPSDPRLIESDAFPFERLSTIAEAESWRKELNRPIYHLHKWWAQRLGSVFRGILLACFLPIDADFIKVFYRPTRAFGRVVFDPFMGSGTTVGEALKLGARAIGRDINPVAVFAVRNALRSHRRTQLSNEFTRIMTEARAHLLPYYSATARGRPVTTQYYFWVKHLPCPDCSQRVDLFRSHVFSKHAYPKKDPRAKVICPHCSRICERAYDVATTTCDWCDHTFDASVGPAKGAYANCPHCSHRFRIASETRKLGHVLHHRMFAKIWIDDSRRRHYEPITKDDLAVFHRASIALASGDRLWPEVEIRPGYNTNQVLTNCYTHWHQMFNERQLLVLGTVGRLIIEVDDDAIRNMLLCAFSGLLEFNNMFTSFKGEGSGAVRHMFSHHILKPERLPFETNPLTLTGSGTFQGIFGRRVLKAIDYARQPFELRIARRGRGAEKVAGLSEAIGLESAIDGADFQGYDGRLYLSVGDSARTDLEAESVDVVVTDPPFFDNVNYSELADFFWVWLRHLDPTLAAAPESTRSSAEVQHRDGREFAQRLARVWKECYRVLASTGLLVFTYHHAKPQGWESLLVALVDSGFVIVACHPVKAELSVARPKAQARHPIDFDIVVVCRKQESTSVPVPTALSQVHSSASAAARHQIDRFNDAGRLLGLGDVRVVLTAQVLRFLSHGLPLPTARAWLAESQSFICATAEEVLDGQQDAHREVADAQMELL